MKLLIIFDIPGTDLETLKRDGAPCRADEESFRFQMAKIKLETLSFWQNISTTIFNFFFNFYIK